MSTKNITKILTATLILLCIFCTSCTQVEEMPDMPKVYFEDYLEEILPNVTAVVKVRYKESLSYESMGKETEPMFQNMGILRNPNPQYNVFEALDIMYGNVESYSIPKLNVGENEIVVKDYPYIMEPNEEKHYYEGSPSHEVMYGFYPKSAEEQDRNKIYVLLLTDEEQPDEYCKYRTATQATTLSVDSKGNFNSDYSFFVVTPLIYYTKDKSLRKKMKNGTFFDYLLERIEKS